MLVACSGGADSLALAAALAFEASAHGLRAGAVVVDHALQPGSAQVAATPRRRCASLGLDPVEVVTVQVDRGRWAASRPAARDARYAALEAAADRLGSPWPCSSATPSTTRPSRCCWASPAASGARSLAGYAGRAAAASRAPFSGWAARHCRGRCAA